MRTLIHLACLAILSALLQGCDSMEPTELDELVVVEAFLYAGEPVTDLRLSEALPVTSDDTVAVPVSNADVSLVKEETHYSLVPSDSSGYYHYAGTDLTVNAGDVFRLEVVYEGATITGQTRVPPPPEAVRLSGQVMEVTTSGGPGGGSPGGPGQLQDDALTVTWENPESELHYVVVSSLTSGNPRYILPEFIRERFTGFQLITSPIDVNFYDVRLRSLEVFGPHEVRVYRVNKEYADLYENREQDSRDLNEPPTNIQGGLGVFSAFNSRTATFDVVENVD